MHAIRAEWKKFAVRTAMIAPALALCFAGSAAAQAADSGPVPLQAVFYTGGCCHDYAALAPLLTRSIAKYANVTWTIKNGLDDFKDPKFAEPYNVVVIDNCFPDEHNTDLIHNICNAVHDGKPIVLIHCAMHTFRKEANADYIAMVGLKTNSHDGFRGISTKNVDPKNPIVRFWPEKWSTAGDELYRNLEFKGHALLTAYSQESKKDHVVAWTNAYGKGRVFATTLGHDAKTAGQDSYQHLLGNGLLWTVDKLTPDGKPAAGYEGQAATSSK